VGPLRAIASLWIYPFLRLILLLAPLSILAFNNNEHVLLRMGSAAIWAVLFQQWAFREELAESTVDIQGDLLIVLVATSNLMLLTDYPNPLLLPLIAAILLVFFLHVLHKDTPTLGPEAKPWRPTPLFGVFLTLLMGSHGLVMAYFGQTTDFITPSSLLLLVSSSCALMLASRPAPLFFMQQWLAIQLCMAPYFYLLDLFALWVHLMWLGALFVILLASARPTRAQSIPFFSGILTLLTTVAELLAHVLTSALLYQLGILFAFAVLAGCLTDDWHTSHVDFPPEMTTASKNWLRLIELVRPLYELTNEDVVQKIILPAAPEIGIARMTLYRVIKPVYAILHTGRDGLSYTFTPTSSLFATLTFVAGPFLAAFIILCSVFQGGGTLARSRFFWLLSTFFCFLFLFASQIANAARVLLVRLLFEGSDFSRTYTATGHAAFFASACVAVCALLLSILPPPSDGVESDDQKLFLLSSSSSSAVGGRFVVPSSQKPKGGYGPVNDTPAAPPPSWLERATTWCVSLVTPPLILFVGGVLVGLVALSLRQFPITHFGLVKIDEPTPPWLYLTTLDRLSPAISSLTDLLVHALGLSGPEARLAMVVLAAINYGLQQLACLPCFCVDADMIEDGLGEVGDLVTSLFHRRRRLLSVVEDLLEGGNATFTHAHMRRLFSDDESALDAMFTLDPDKLCTSRSSPSCDGISVCLSDIVKPIAKLEKIVVGLFTRGLEFAATLIVEQLMKLLGPAAEAISDAFDHMAELVDLPDFDLFALPAVPALPSFAALLPDIRLPSLFVPSLSTLISLGIAFLVLVGFVVVTGMASRAFRVVRDGVLTALFINVICFVVFLVAMGYLVVDEVRAFGYRIEVRWHRQATLYVALSLALMLLAAILFVMRMLLPPSSSSPPLHSRPAKLRASPSPPPLPSSSSSSMVEMKAPRTRPQK